jgi:Na+-driven multidrug efflux pump
LIRQVLALVPLIYIFPIFFGTLGIFCAEPVSDFLATILSAVFIRKEFQTFSD